MRARRRPPSSAECDRSDRPSRLFRTRSSSCDRPPDSPMSLRGSTAKEEVPSAGTPTPKPSLRGTNKSLLAGLGGSDRLDVGFGLGRRQSGDRLEVDFHFNPCIADAIRLALDPTLLQGHFATHL